MSSVKSCRWGEERDCGSGLGVRVLHVKSFVCHYNDIHFKAPSFNYILLCLPRISKSSVRRSPHRKDKHVSEHHLEEEDLLLISFLIFCVKNITSADLF